MTMTFIILAALALALGLRYATGFRAQRPQHYVASTPVFDVRESLKGPMLCEGVIYGPFGRVSTRFVAQMFAEWQGNEGRMTEEFHYDSGTIQHREWTLKLSEMAKFRPLHQI